jgi:hypothetical protein
MGWWRGAAEKVMKYMTTYTTLTSNGGRRIIIYVQIECVGFYSGLLAVKLQCTPAISEGWFIHVLVHSETQCNGRVVL